MAKNRLKLNKITTTEERYWSKYHLFKKPFTYNNDKVATSLLSQNTQSNARQNTSSQEDNVQNISSSALKRLGSNNNRQ